MPSRVPTTPGIPYSRATMAEWDEQAAAVRHDTAEQRQKDVEGLGRRLGDEDVPLDDPVELDGDRRPAAPALRRRPGSPLTPRSVAPWWGASELPKSD